MSGLNYKKLRSTLSNICNTTQLDDTTECHYALKNFWGEQGPKNFRILTRPPAILHSSYS